MFPDASVDVYVRVYVPILLATKFTVPVPSFVNVLSPVPSAFGIVPDVITLTVPEESVAVAPGSV